MLKEFLAIACAIAGALTLNYAIYLEKKAVVNLPTVEFKSPWQTTKAFISNKPWIWAQAVNITGFVLYSVALALAPVSIIEPIIASGVVLLAYLAIKHLGETPRRIDYAAMGMSVLGVALIGVSLAEGLPKDKLNHGWEIVLFAAVILGLAILIPLLMRGTQAKLSVGLGISVGLFFGMAAVFQRLLMLYLVNISTHWDLFLVFLVACICTYIPAFILLQAALQKGMAIIVAPIYNGIMEFIPIFVGMMALNESFPASNLLKVVRIIAFVLILTGTVILSQRAEAEEVPEGFPVGELEAMQSEA
jgi:multidrug transporter EmrE-like cation transporter